MNKTAIVIGATGLVGAALVELLMHDNRFGKIKAFVRSSADITHHRFEEFHVDFDRPDQWSHQVTGDVLFSCLGTTLKKAGSKQNQYKIDHTYQYEFAKAAAANRVPVYVLVSAYMSDPGASMFYPRMKGELERDIKKLHFQKIVILQPGILKGTRKEKRTGEALSTKAIEWLNSNGILSSQKPVPASTVAQAMINSVFNQQESLKTYKLPEVFSLAGN